MQEYLQLSLWHRQTPSAAIRKNFFEYGLETRVHGNSQIRPHNALSWDMVMNIVKFICNYAEENAILLPGCIPTHKRDDIKLLPSSDSKKVQYTHTIYYKMLAVENIGEFGQFNFNSLMFQEILLSI